jgi:hypothetical protein
MFKKLRQRLAPQRAARQTSRPTASPTLASRARSRFSNALLGVMALTGVGLQSGCADKPVVEETPTTEVAPEAVAPVAPVITLVVKTPEPAPAPQPRALDGWENLAAAMADHPKVVEDAFNPNESYDSAKAYLVKITGWTDVLKVVDGLPEAPTNADQLLEDIGSQFGEKVEAKAKRAFASRSLTAAHMTTLAEPVEGGDASTETSTETNTNAASSSVTVASSSSASKPVVVDRRNEGGTSSSVSASANPAETTGLNDGVTPPIRALAITIDIDEDASFNPLGSGAASASNASGPEDTGEAYDSGQAPDADDIAPEDMAFLNDDDDLDLGEFSVEEGGEDIKDVTDLLVGVNGETVDGIADLDAGGDGSGDSSGFVFNAEDIDLSRTNSGGESVGDALLRIHGSDDTESSSELEPESDDQEVRKTRLLNLLFEWNLQSHINVLHEQGVTSTDLKNLMNEGLNANSIKKIIENTSRGMDFQEAAKRESLLIMSAEEYWNYFETNYNLSTSKADEFSEAYVFLTLRTFEMMLMTKGVRQDRHKAAFMALSEEDPALSVKELVPFIDKWIASPVSGMNRKDRSAFITEFSDMHSVDKKLINSLFRNGELNISDLKEIAGSVEDVEKVLNAMRRGSSKADAIAEQIQIENNPGRGPVEESNEEGEGETSDEEPIAPVSSTGSDSDSSLTSTPSSGRLDLNDDEDDIPFVEFDGFEPAAQFRGVIIDVDDMRGDGTDDQDEEPAETRTMSAEEILEQAEEEPEDEWENNIDLDDDDEWGGELNIDDIVEPIPKGDDVPDTQGFYQPQSPQQNRWVIDAAPKNTAIAFNRVDRVRGNLSSWRTSVPAVEKNTKSELNTWIDRWLSAA